MCTLSSVHGALKSVLHGSEKRSGEDSTQMVAAHANAEEDRHTGIIVMHR